MISLKKEMLKKFENARIEGRLEEVIRFFIENNFLTSRKFKGFGALIRDNCEGGRAVPFKEIELVYEGTNWYWVKGLHVDKYVELLRGLNPDKEVQRIDYYTPDLDNVEVPF